MGRVVVGVVVMRVLLTWSPVVELCIWRRQWWLLRVVEGGRRREGSGGVRVAFSRWHFRFFSKWLECCVVERSTAPRIQDPFVESGRCFVNQDYTCSGIRIIISPQL